MSRNQIPGWLTDFITKYLVPLELVLTLGVLIGYFMQLAEAEYGSLIFSMALTILAVVYFLAGFAPVTDKTWIKQVSTKAFYIGMAMALMGVLYTGLQLPGADLMMKIGLISITISMLLIVVTSVKDWDITVTRLIIRGITVILLAVLIILNQQP